MKNMFCVLAVCAAVGCALTEKSLRTTDSVAVDKSEQAEKPYSARVVSGENATTVPSSSNADSITNQSGIQTAAQIVEDGGDGIVYNPPGGGYIREIVVQSALLGPSGQKPSFDGTATLRIHYKKDIEGVFTTKTVLAGAALAYYPTHDGGPIDLVKVEGADKRHFHVSIFRFIRDFRETPGVFLGRNRRRRGSRRPFV